MYYVYVLKSIKDGNLYVGSSNDLRRRLSEHNEGKSFSTKSRKPFELRYYEAYSSEKDARAREQGLKNDGRALAQLKRRLGNSLE